MMAIKRFDMFDCHNDDESWSEMKQKTYGEYVRYRDVESVIAQHDELLSALVNITLSVLEWDKNGRVCDLGDLIDTKKIVDLVEKCEAQS